ncbi:MAG: hypothetical protein PHG53_09485 [Phycisphaerae bacterium]|nr:hypothetical protein [Phycisphaerae bacterium]
MIVDFNPVLSIKQTEAFDALEDLAIDEVLFGGAKYGGKSWFLCVWVFLTACRFIREHNIPQSDHPLPIGFIGRKIAKHFKDTTLETWFKTIPVDGYVVKDDPASIIIDNRVKVDTGGFDNRETIKKFNSAEYAFYAIDQAEETTEDDLSLLRAATFGRLVVNGKPIAGKALYTANPAQCWLKKEFIDSVKPNKRFISALPSDNPYCTQRYIDNLKDSFKHRPELLQAYLYGNWSAIEGVNQVIKSNWVSGAAVRLWHKPNIVKKVIACDPARFGDDETVIYYLEDGVIVDELIYGMKDTIHTANQIAWLMDAKGCKTAIIDVIGIGAGIVDWLNERNNTPDNEHREGKGWTIIGFNSAEKAVDENRFYNKRAEAWDYAAKQFSDGKVILRSDGKKDIVLENQLCLPCYEFRNGRMLIENKDDIKKRLSSSPDRADAYIMGIWANGMFTINDGISVNHRIDLTPSAYHGNPLTRGMRIGAA